MVLNTMSYKERIDRLDETALLKALGLSGASILGVWGSRPQILGRESWWGLGSRRGSLGVLDGWWNIIISYHVQKVSSKVMTF